MIRFYEVSLPKIMFKYLFLKLFLFEFFMSNLDASCPLQWHSFADKCFYIDNNKRTAEENYEFCRKMNSSMKNLLFIGWEA
ncbi:hypothetical protein B4U79_18007 [Dinothrombium tinctorium]|uniref:C-type lectin domain-containing protein n=1 Tax=Dinothrombium tinctorium TaxID=1965070 RepID=A0A3S3PCI2_9ACAR|nr:hypothetical protein B4U79_18388 [Dinothrombium tinctorium]RWS04054.1 hypothetical protein B4U79_18387 [Dinothrombium tinctorium]RWS12465.1 hypothetical protein B4U79_18007 [Dinothrombium tinctorium]